MHDRKEPVHLGSGMTVAISAHTALFNFMVVCADDHTLSQDLLLSCTKDTQDNKIGITWDPKYT